MQLIPIGIFVFVILADMSGKVHRTVAALTGVVILLATNILSVEKSMSYVDFNTIGMLVGMMIFVAVVKCSGLFEYISIKVAKLVKGDPWKLMVAFMVITAVLSAFLDNVTTVLLVGPMTIAITRILKLDPVPFLMTQILASNIGGTSTLIGDPPNIMIGSAAHLSFLDFITHLGLACLIIMVVVIFAMKFIYGKRLTTDGDVLKEVMQLDEKKAISDKPLLIKSLIVIVLVLIGFCVHDTIHMESSVIALAAAVIMLLIGRQNPEHIILEIEWATILFFMGLFIIVGGLVETGVIDAISKFIVGFTSGHVIFATIILLWSTAILSSVLNNIPFVAALIPLVLIMQKDGLNVEPIWWAISLGACLGGNGTLIGASANVVLASIGNKNGHPITFKSYMKVGFPMMLLTISISTVYLLVAYWNV